MKSYLLIMGISFICAVIFSYAVLKFARRFKIYAKIRNRDMHSTPIPRLGGIALLISLLIAVFLSSALPWFSDVYLIDNKILSIVFASCLIVLLGVFDDIFGLVWYAKLSGQFLVSYIIVASDIQITSIPLFETLIFSPSMSRVMTMVFIVFAINAVNFLDGLDGLVSSVMLIVSSIFFVYVYLLIRIISPFDYFAISLLILSIVIGLSSGFLILNWHPAKIFLGDSGSMLLGMLFAVCVILTFGQIDSATLFQNNAWLALLFPILVFCVPIVDFLASVIRRIAVGKSPFSPDKYHIHHLLLRLGHNIYSAVITCCFWTFLIGSLCIISLWLSAIYVLLIFIIMFLMAVILTFYPSFQNIFIRKLHLKSQYELSLKENKKKDKI